MRIIAYYIIIILCTWNLDAQDGWLRSADGRWSIPQGSISLREGFEGEGEKIRFHAYDPKTPTLVWFERFKNITVKSLQNQLIAGTMPQEFVFPSDFALWLTLRRVSRN